MREEISFLFQLHLLPILRFWDDNEHFFILSLHLCCNIRNVQANPSKSEGCIVKKLFVAAIICTLALVAGADIITNYYGWENGATILGSYGNVSNPLNVSIGSDPGQNNEDPTYDPWRMVGPR